MVEWVNEWNKSNKINPTKWCQLKSILHKINFITNSHLFTDNKYLLRRHTSQIHKLSIHSLHCCYYRQIFVSYVSSIKISLVPMSSVGNNIVWRQNGNCRNMSPLSCERIRPDLSCDALINPFLNVDMHRQFLYQLMSCLTQGMFIAIDLWSQVKFWLNPPNLTIIKEIRWCRK